MSRNKQEVIERVKNNMSLQGFEELIPPGIDAKSIYNRTLDEFVEEEATEVLAEIALTVTAACDRDDFHSWNYDHLEYIIELSNEFGFSIPKNLLNGLPEQLIILVDSDKVDRDCT